MQIQTANRLTGIGEYYFSQKLKEIDQMNKAGIPVINLGIGSPDLPPHPEVVKVLQEAAALPDTHAYQSYKGSPVFRKAIADWYREWYKVELNPDTEVLPLIGSKEGIMHICMTYLNPGDEALIPNPGYPTYRSAVTIAGATPVEYLLHEENKWQIDFAKLETRDLTRVKLMWVNYPHMPTGALPDKNFFSELIAFAKKHNILVCHDNPYSFILNDHPMSLLEIDGAKDVVVELNSLSKSKNMAGWRVGMVCAAAERISEILIFKSNMDSGMFLPVQLAAARALQLDAEWYREVNSIYQKRKKKAAVLLQLLGCTFDHHQSGMFLWAKIPPHFASGFELSDKVLYDARVFITPGGIFGSAGNNYIRVSLCSTEEKFTESAKRIQQAFEQ